MRRPAKKLAKLDHAISSRNPCVHVYFNNTQLATNETYYYIDS